jgi:hypothetical protein
MILAGTKASTFFLFFSCSSRPLHCWIGDEWRAAHSVRSIQPQCWFLPVTRAFPTVMPFRPPHHTRLLYRVCIVRINVHGSKDRAKDASSDQPQRSLVRKSSAYALWRMLTTFPSSASFGHPLSSVRLLVEGDTPTCIRTNQDPLSSNDPRRSPPFRRSGCLSPSRHTKESCLREGFFNSLRPSYRLSRSRRSHFLLFQGVMPFLMSIASVTVRSPAPSVTVRECRHLFDSLVLPRLDLTTQARHRARPAQPSTGTVCPARTDASRSA